MSQTTFRYQKWHHFQLSFLQSVSTNSIDPDFWPNQTFLNVYQKKKKKKNIKNWSIDLQFFWPISGNTTFFFVLGTWCMEILGSSLVPPFGTDGLIFGPWLTDHISSLNVFTLTCLLACVLIGINAASGKSFCALNMKSRCVEGWITVHRNCSWSTLARVSRASRMLHLCK